MLLMCLLSVGSGCDGDTQDQRGSRYVPTDVIGTYLAKLPDHTQLDIFGNGKFNCAGVRASDLGLATGHSLQPVCHLEGTWVIGDDGDGSEVVRLIVTSIDGVLTDRTLIARVATVPHVFLYIDFPNKGTLTVHRESD